MVKPENDWYLIGLKNNDSAVIKSIVTNCGKPLASWILQNNGSQSETKDVVQYALTTMWQKARDSGFVLTSAFCTYFFSVGKKYWQNELRKKKYQRNVTKEDLKVYTTDNLDPSTLMEEKERHQLVQDNLKKLSESCQHLLLLVWHGKQTLKDLCKVKGWNYVNTRQQKSRCEKKLEELIREDPRFKDFH